MTIEVDMERKRKIGNAVCYGMLSELMLTRSDLPSNTNRHIINILFQPLVFCVP